MLVEVPTDREFQIFRKVWNTLDSKPAIDEQILILSLARDLKMTVGQIDEVLAKVGAYKECEGEEVKKRAYAGIQKAIRGRVDEVFYESVSDTLSVKLLAPSGWTVESMKVGVREDLIRAVRMAFGASETVRKVMVGIYTQYDVINRRKFTAKIAFIEMTSTRFEECINNGFNNAGIDEMERMGVWFHDCMI